jgi:hypothetical protein
MDPARKALAIKGLRGQDPNRFSSARCGYRLRAPRSLTLLAKDEPVRTSLHASAKDAREST